MCDSPPTTIPSVLKINKQCPPDQEINILLLGQTGVGKSTFINSLANYLVNDNFDEAIHDEMQVIIPTSFYFTDPETFEEKLINISDKKNSKEINENGQSCTQQCRSFVFPFGQRNLRLIDTPGMGDTRGSQQDNENLFEILTYISYYEHLNGICIFLKPNEERLTIIFRLIIKQILHYLEPSVSKNITFILTNARSTFYTPGSSKKLLQVLINEYHDKYHLEIPLSKDNTFLLDNETLRYSGLCKAGIQINNEQIQIYKKSWDYTIKEYERLITYLCQCPLHAVANTLSINSAEQLIKQLSRPIAETIRLIQQNIQLANEHKQKPSKKKTNATHKLPQYIANIGQIIRPNLVCISKKCLQLVESDNHQKLIYRQICQKDRYLDGVIQETINDPRIQKSKVINHETGKCSVCECSWNRHMNITYEYQTNLTYVNMNDNASSKNDDHVLIQNIQGYIDNLQKEQEMIKDIYMELLKFLYVNAIHPCNNDIVEYLRLFILEEHIKRNAGISNDEIIDNLTKTMTQYEHDIDILKKNLAKQDSADAKDVLTAEKVFLQVGNLYRLPINGQQFRDQIDILKFVEAQGVKAREKHIKLPQKAATSRIMHISNDVTSSRR